MSIAAVRHSVYDYLAPASRPRWSSPRSPPFSSWRRPRQTMGDAQRIVYIHVSVAWMGLASFVVMAGAGGMYLARRDLGWDHWSRAALEIGWLCCSLTLATGSLWAHSAWNTWWTWDPRLTTAFVLWAMYSAALVLRSGVNDPHRRRASARWWRSSACWTCRW